MQPDTVIPDLSNPQSWNRYSYVVNNPINATDPSGHKCSDVEAGACDDSKGSSVSSPTPPLPDPDNSTSDAGDAHDRHPSTANNDHKGDDWATDPNFNYNIIQTAISYLQYSPLGQASYDYLVSIANASIVFNTPGDCSGHGGNPIIVPAASCSPSSVYIAGTIAHEAAHISIHADGTLLEEYQAMLIGDIVRNDLIQAGYGTSLDMRHPLSDFTVNLNNPNKNQLSTDLINWFIYNERIYIDKYNLPALPLARDLDRDR